LEFPTVIYDSPLQYTDTGSSVLQKFGKNSEQILALINLRNTIPHIS